MAATARPATSQPSEEDGLYYDKPGQRYPTPSPGSGDRVFYDSLFKENPKSNIALAWLIEHGVFSKEEAIRLTGRFQEARAAMRQMSIATAASLAIEPASASATDRTAKSSSS